MPCSSKTSGHCGDDMTHLKIEKIIESIESFYVPEKKQLEPITQAFDAILSGKKVDADNKIYIHGNSCFTADEVSKLNRFNINREKIYKELKQKLDEKAYFNVLLTIYNGFIYIEDDRDSIEPLVRLYREAKKKIEKRVEDVNKDLAATNPYFKNFPVVIEFKHHLDSNIPPKMGAPIKNKNMLIKDISNHLSSCILGKTDRAKLIERILRFFYAVLKAEANHRSIRSYC